MCWCACCFTWGRISARFSKSRWGAWQAVVSVHTSRLILNLMQVFLPTHLVHPLLSMPIRKPLAASFQSMKPSLARSHEPCCNPELLPYGWISFIWLNPLVLPGQAFRIQLPLVLAVSVGAWSLLFPSLAMSHSSAESLWFTPRSERGRSGSPTPPDISYQPWKVTADRGGSRLMSQPQLQHMAGRVWPSFNPAKYAKKENECVWGNAVQGFFYFLNTFLLLYL